MSEVKTFYRIKYEDELVDKEDFMTIEPSEADSVEEAKEVFKKKYQMDSQSVIDSKCKELFSFDISMVNNLVEDKELNMS